LDALLPLERLRSAADFCWDQGEATGDARYCVLWRCLDAIAQRLEDDDNLTQDIVDDLNHAFARHLPGVLSAPTAEEGTWLARMLREDIFAVDAG
jgi:hypothetical protein